MKYYEIYNNVKFFCLVGILSIFTFSCDDTGVIEEVLEPSYKMWVNGSEIIVEDYYESVTTYGLSDHYHEAHEGLCLPGDPMPCDKVKKLFVIHFQREDGRVTPEKEHYALIMYDNDGLHNNNNLIDEGLYLGGTQVDSTLLTGKGITLEIVGLSDYTEFAQASIDSYEEGVVSGIADGYFFNPYRNEMQHGIIIFDNIEIGTDSTATFYQGIY